jgi:uncharacterized protein (TIGR03083 family)
VPAGHLLADLHHELMALLRALTAADWDRPTSAGEWRVRDVAAHVLDGDLRRLSFHRDGHAPGAPPEAASDEGALVRFLDGLNADWVRAARRLSPPVLVDLLAASGAQVAAFLAGLAPQREAFFPVAWSGPGASPQWLDVGREFTERWQHQQQIREAVGARLLTEPRWLRPVLAISAWALPHAYRAVDAPDGTAVTLEVQGAAGGQWSVARADGRWRLEAGGRADARSTVSLDEDAAWRLFFRGLTRAQARARAQVAGDRDLGEVLLGVLAVMAPAAPEGTPGPS